MCPDYYYLLDDIIERDHTPSFLLVHVYLHHIYYTIQQHLINPFFTYSAAPYPFLECRKPHITTVSLVRSRKLSRKDYCCTVERQRERERGFAMYVYYYVTFQGELLYFLHPFTPHRYTTSYFTLSQLYFPILFPFSLSLSSTCYFIFPCVKILLCLSVCEPLVLTGKISQIFIRNNSSSTTAVLVFRLMVYLYLY